MQFKDMIAVNRKKKEIEILFQHAYPNLLWTKRLFFLLVQHPSTYLLNM